MKNTLRSYRQKPCKLYKNGSAIGKAAANP
jgi:hypothetical protein